MWPWRLVAPLFRYGHRELSLSRERTGALTEAMGQIFSAFPGRLRGDTDFSLPRHRPFSERCRWPNGAVPTAW